MPARNSVLPSAAAMTALQTAPGLISVPATKLSLPYTYAATINSILECYALPVFADADPKPTSSTPRSRQARQRSNASYFARTHRRCACRHGRVPGAEKHDLPVIEDAHCGHAASGKRKKPEPLERSAASVCKSRRTSRAGRVAVLTDDEYPLTKFGTRIRTASAPPGASLGRLSTGARIKLPHDGVLPRFFRAAALHRRARGYPQRKRAPSVCVIARNTGRLSSARLRRRTQRVAFVYVPSRRRRVRLRARRIDPSDSSRGNQLRDRLPKLRLMGYVRNA